MSKYVNKQALLKWLEQRYQENNGRFDVDELEILAEHIKLFAGYLQGVIDLIWKVHQKVRLLSEDELKKLIGDLNSDTSR